MVLANVPSFRFSFRGNIRRNHPFGNHPFANTKKAHWEIRGRFCKRVVLANVPSFRFSFRGNIRRNHPFGKHPFANPRQIYRRYSDVSFQMRARGCLVRSAGLCQPQSAAMQCGLGPRSTWPQKSILERV